MKHNQKGFTLIELVLVVAIIAIMAAVLGTFLTTGTNSFNSVSKNAKVQENLQETMNRIHDLIIDAKNCINVSESNGQTTELTIYNYNQNATPSEKSPDGRTYEGIKSIDIVTYDPDKKELYHQQKIKYVYKIEKNVVEDPAYSLVTPTSVLMAENITGFHVNLSDLSSEQVVSFSASVTEKGYSAELKDRVSLRNVIIGNKMDYDFQDFPIREPAKITIMAPENMISGTKTKLTYSLSGYVLNTSVKWMIEDSSASETKGSTIDANGNLYAVGSGLISIKAIALGDPAHNEIEEKAFEVVQILIKSK